MAKESKLRQIEHLLAKPALAAPVRAALQEEASKLQQDMALMKVFKVEAGWPQVEPSGQCLVCGRPVHPCQKPGQYVHLECLPCAAT